jgi:hypothetical protein
MTRRWLCHEVPIHDKDGSMVQLVLPVNLRRREARRLQRILDALVCYTARVYTVPEDDQPPRRYWI